MKKYILSIDQGTTGSTALLVDSLTFKVVGKCNHEFPQIFPKPGYVEHNLEEIWSSIKSSIIDVLKETKIKSNQIESIGITNQRETTCAYTKDGTPLFNAIVWQDRRTKQFCEDNSKSYAELKQKTGLPLDSYFSATKMKWLLDNCHDVKEASKNNNLLFSTIDSFVLYRLSNCNSFLTEPSNASRTLLMDLKTTNWDSKLLDFFSIDESTLPKISDSFSNFGKTENLDFLPDGIPITCILGDQQSALFGQGGNEKCDLKCTYGTGAFILLNTGSKIEYSKNNLLTTVAYQHKGKPFYALEGSTYIAGAAVQWLRDNLKIIKSSANIETLAKLAKDEKMEDIFFFPFFTGIGSPYWNSDATATITGLTRGTTDSEIARAALEGIALSINDSIMALVADVKVELSEIFVDGGASLNDYLMQIQSNFSNCKISRPEVIETTAYGAALGALVGLDRLTFKEIKDLRKIDKTFSPKPSEYSIKKLKEWSRLIKKIY
jgi:glycerol kinase